MKRIFGLFTVLLVLIALTGCNSATSAPSTIYNPTSLSWTPPTTNTDGSAITDGAGFKLYCGTASGQYVLLKDVLGWAVTSYAIQPSDFADGVKYCAVTAYNLAGAESAYSSEVNFTISRTVPGAPTGLRANK